MRAGCHLHLVGDDECGMHIGGDYDGRGGAGCHLCLVGDDECGMHIGGDYYGRGGLDVIFIWLATMSVACTSAATTTVEAGWMSSSFGWRR